MLLFVQDWNLDLRNKIILIFLLNLLCLFILNKYSVHSSTAIMLIINVINMVWMLSIRTLWTFFWNTFFVIILRKKNVRNFSNFDVSLIILWYLSFWIKENFPLFIKTWSNTVANYKKELYIIPVYIIYNYEIYERIDFF